MGTCNKKLSTPLAPFFPGGFSKYQVILNFHRADLSRSMIVSRPNFYFPLIDGLGNTSPSPPLRLLSQLFCPRRLFFFSACTLMVPCRTFSFSLGDHPRRTHFELSLSVFKDPGSSSTSDCNPMFFLKNSFHFPRRRALTARVFPMRRFPAPVESLSICRRYRSCTAPLPHPFVFSPYDSAVVFWTH